LSSSLRPTVIVLASGRGERFKASGGQTHKLQALLSGRSVLDWTLAAVRASGLPFHVEDAGHQSMGDSIAAAVRATAGAQGWLVLPADLPLVQAQTILAVASALDGTNIVQPSYQGVKGHPVGFSARYYVQLSALKENAGGFSVIRSYGAIKIVVNDIGCVADIDTLDDLKQAQLLLDQTAA
jgi:molybdenum cofactor cytidylyltransferase